MTARRVLVCTLAMLWLANGAGAQALNNYRPIPDDHERVTAAAFLITYGTTFLVQI